MADAFATLRTKDVAHATPQINVLQRVGGSIGTAILTVALTNALAHAGSRSPEAAAGAFGHAYGWAAAVTAFAVLPALYLAYVERRERVRRAGLHAAVDGEILPADREPLAARGP
jgi:hypothetical protein